MPDSNEIAKQVNNPLQEIDFKHIIGGPPTSCEQAQEEASQATMNYLDAVAFQKSTDVVGDLEPVTVTFLYQANGRYRRLTMPLIMLVPVPYLQIDAVDFSFKATVTTCSKGSLKAKYMRGNVSTSATSEVQAKNYIDIQMRATPASLPSGISKLIELMSNDMAVLANEE